MYYLINLVVCLYLKCFYEIVDMEMAIYQFEKYVILLILTTV